MDIARPFLLVYSILGHKVCNIGSTLKMEAAGTPEILVTAYRTSHYYTQKIRDILTWNHCLYMFWEHFSATKVLRFSGQ
jgi:hypothetical protein